MKKTSFLCLLVLALVISTGCAITGIKPEPPATVLSPEDQRVEVARKALTEAESSLKAANDAVEAAEKNALSCEVSVGTCQAEVREALTAKADKIAKDAADLTKLVNDLRQEVARLGGEAPAAPRGNVEAIPGDFTHDDAPQPLFVDMEWNGTTAKRLTPYPEGWMIFVDGKKITLKINGEIALSKILLNKGRYHVTATAVTFMP